jgi:hypothetical protein
MMSHFLCCGIGCANDPIDAQKEGEEEMPKPVYPGTVRKVFPGERKQVVVANPRNQGRRYFVFKGSRMGAQEGEPTPNGAKLVIEYSVLVHQVVLLKDGSLVPPVMRVKYSRFGAFGGV